MGASKQATRFMCTFSTEYFAWDKPDAVRSSTQTNPASFMTPGLNDFGDSTEGGPSQVHLSFRITF